MPSRCPTCDKALPARATDCRACGWTQSNVVAIMVSPDHLRCEWRSNGQRCFNVGGMSPVNHTSQSNTPHPGPWYCGEHFACRDMESGGEIVDHSKRNDVTDWTPTGILARLRWQSLSKPHDLPTKAQVALNIAGLKAMLSQAALRSPGKGLSVTMHTGARHPVVERGDAWEPEIV